MDFLSTSTGYSISTVRSACTFLQSLGLITRAGRYDGWDCVYSLTAEFLSYPLSPTTTSATIVETIDLLNKPVEEEVNTTLRNVNSTLRNVNTTLRDLLFSHGVGEPMCSYLANLDHVTVDYVTAHFDYGHKKGDPIGLIIHRIRSGDPQPLQNIDVVEDYRRSWRRD